MSGPLPKPLRSNGLRSSVPVLRPEPPPTALRLQEEESQSTFLRLLLDCSLRTLVRWVRCISFGATYAACRLTTREAISAWLATSCVPLCTFRRSESLQCAVQRHQRSPQSWQ